MPPQRLSRRSFLQAGTAASLAFAAPTIIPAAALGRDGRVAPSERIVLAAIGSGGKGQHNLAAFAALPDVQVAAVCDVDRKHLDIGAAVVDKHYGNADCARHTDFREIMNDKGIDAVCVSTPDHWHAHICVAAASAGKDVYCEKPLANSVSEGRSLVEAVTEHGRILQVGSHERSNPRILFARELIRQGHLGELKSIRIQMPTDQAHHDHVRKSLAPPVAEQVPDGFDYDFWLGHAPRAPYCAGRCHFWWRFVLCYGGGEMTDRGSHIIDLAQLIAGRDATGPVQIKAHGQRNPSGLYDAFMSYEFVNTYDDGLQLVGECRGPRGLRFEGTAGSLFIAIHGGQLESDPKALVTMKLEGFDPEDKNAPSHHQNFIDCVRSRTQPRAPVEAGHRTATVCHLNNIAMRLGRDLKWDPEHEQILGDDEANALLRPPMREPWVL